MNRFLEALGANPNGERYRLSLRSFAPCSAYSGHLPWCSHRRYMWPKTFRNGNASVWLVPNAMHRKEGKNGHEPCEPLLAPKTTLAGQALDQGNHVFDDFSLLTNALREVVALPDVALRVLVPAIWSTGSACGILPINTARTVGRAAVMSASCAMAGCFR